MATPNYNWIIPTVTGDLNIWGTKLNTVFNAQDAVVRQIENCNIGNSPPSTLATGTLWINNSSNPWPLQVYDGSNWVVIGTIDESKHTFTATNASADFVGDYKLSMQTSNHGNWLLCDGSAVSRTTYATLYALGGGTGSWPWGQGDGITTFNLPDARGLVGGAIGKNAATFPAPFVTPPSTRTLGQYFGEETHQLVIAEMPAHTHTYNSALNTAGGSGGTVLGTGTSTTNSTGGDGSHNTMQPTAFLGNYFVYTG